MAQVASVPRHMFQKEEGYLLALFFLKLKYNFEPFGGSNGTQKVFTRQSIGSAASEGQHLR